MAPNWDGKVESLPKDWKEQTISKLRRCPIDYYEKAETPCVGGTSFWDGDWEKGKELTQISKSFGESQPYVGDDGQIYIM